MFEGKDKLQHRMHYSIIGLMLLWLLWLTACQPLIPATTPPQLGHTPGAFVVVDANRFDGGFFRVDYPDGWRVIKTSVASAPLEVVFASPDNSMTIRIVESQNPLPESTPEADTHVRREAIAVSANVTLTIIGNAPDDTAAAFDNIFDRVYESLVIID